MLLVEKVRRIPRIQRHGREAVPLLEWGARPLPHPSHLSLAGEPVAVCCDGYWVPVLESNVGTSQAEEERIRFG